MPERVVLGAMLDASVTLDLVQERGMLAIAAAQRWAVETAAAIQASAYYSHNLMAVGAGLVLGLVVVVVLAYNPGEPRAPYEPTSLATLIQDAKAEANAHVARERPKKYRRKGTGKKGKEGASAAGKGAAEGKAKAKAAEAEAGEGGGDAAASAGGGAGSEGKGSPAAASGAGVRSRKGKGKGKGKGKSGGAEGDAGASDAAVAASDRKAGKGKTSDDDEEEGAAAATATATATATSDAPAHGDGGSGSEDPFDPRHAADSAWETDSDPEGIEEAVMASLHRMPPKLRESMLATADLEELRGRVSRARKQVQSGEADTAPDPLKAGRNLARGCDCFIYLAFFAAAIYIGVRDYDLDVGFVLSYWFPRESATIRGGPIGGTERAAPL